MCVCVCGGGGGGEAPLAPPLDPPLYSFTKLEHHTCSFYKLVTHNIHNCISRLCRIMKVSSPYKQNIYVRLHSVVNGEVNGPYLKQTISRLENLR